jgi:hypothetical protein
MHRKRLNISTVLAGQRLGIRSLQSKWDAPMFFTFPENAAVRH